MTAIHPKLNAHVSRYLMTMTATLVRTAPFVSTTIAPSLYMVLPFTLLNLPSRSTRRPFAQEACTNAALPGGADVPPQPSPPRPAPTPPVGPLVVQSCANEGSMGMMLVAF